MSKSAALRAVKRSNLETRVRREYRETLMPWETLTISPRDAAHLASRMERKAKLRDARGEARR